MLADKLQAQQWLREYSVQDLARSLIRQFLIKNQLPCTLSQLQQQDLRSSKKINKTILVRLLSMNNIVYHNKMAEKPYRSLLEVLVGYLREKFRGSCGAEQGGGAGGGRQGYSQRHTGFERSLNSTGSVIGGEGGKRVRPTTSKGGKVEQIYGEIRKQTEREKAEAERRAQAEELRKKQEGSLKRLEEERLKKLAEQKLKEIQESKKQEQRKQTELRKKLQEEENQRKKQQQMRIAQRQEQQRQKRKAKQQEQRRERQKKMQQQQEAKRKQEEQKQRLLEQQRRILEQQRRKKQQLQQKKREEQTKRKQQQQKAQKQIKKQREQKEREQKQREQNARKKQQQDRIRKEEEQEARKRAEQQAKKLLQQKVKEKESEQKPTFILPQSQNQVKGQPALDIKPRANTMRKLIKNKKTAEGQNNPVQQTNPQPVTIQSQVKQLQVNQTPQQPKKYQEQQKRETQEEPKKMINVFGKKKKQKIDQPAEQMPGKFKFDQNFVDESPHQLSKTYQYQKINLTQITLAKPSHPELPYNQKHIPITKKFPQKTITQPQSQKLKKLVFQSNPAILPKSWQQGFILSPYAATPYGLQQIQGGPCGIIAAVQCYFLKHILHMAGLQSQAAMSNQLLRENCLVAAIADMLMKVKNTSDRVVLTLPPESFSGAKIDIATLRLVTHQCISLLQAYDLVNRYRSYFIGKTNHGVAVLLYSLILTKGIDNILSEVDMPDNPLIGNHGHCTQQLVNLFITGHASSNCFDGNKTLDSQLTLKGIPHRAQFGFLTIFQTLKYLQVGSYLKNPVYPFWIICKQFHYHVIFTNNHLIAQNNNTPKFDIVYFDGLYNCGDRIVITLEKYGYEEEMEMRDKIKVKDMALIEQVMGTKWGLRKADWNGSTRIL